jgi:hypothetical protein
MALSVGSWERGSIGRVAGTDGYLEGKDSGSVDKGSHLPMWGRREGLSRPHLLTALPAGRDEVSAWHPQGSMSGSWASCLHHQHQMAQCCRRKEEGASIL